MFAWASRGVVPYLLRRHPLDVLVVLLLWRFGSAETWSVFASLLNTTPVAIFASTALGTMWILRPAIYDELTVGQILKYYDVHAYIAWKRERGEELD